MTHQPINFLGGGANHRVSTLSNDADVIGMRRWFLERRKGGGYLCTRFPTNRRARSSREDGISYLLFPFFFMHEANRISMGQDDRKRTSVYRRVPLRRHG